MQTKTSFFRHIQISFLSALTLFVFLFGAMSAFAAFTKDTPGPQNELSGGAFMHWMQEVLIKDSLPQEEKVFQPNQEFSRPTFKQSHRIVNSQNETVAISQNKKLGIGKQNPEKTLDIEANTPRVTLSSPQNPEIKFLAEGTSGKIFFHQGTKELVFANNSKVALSFSKEGTANAQQFAKEKGKTIVKGNQKCASGMYVRGFDKQGGILCY